MEDICLELTFDGQSCLYEGPASMKIEPVTLIFHNQSNDVAGPHLIRLLGEKTYRDVIDLLGEEPSEEFPSSWSVSIARVWAYTAPGENHVWTGVLQPGIHVLLCAMTYPLGAWLGGEFTVEE